MTDPHHRTYRVTIPTGGATAGPPAPTPPGAPGPPAPPAPPRPPPGRRAKVVAIALGVVAIVGVLVAASMTRDGDRRPEAGTAARPGERPERTTQRTTTTAAPTTTTTARPPPPFDGAGPSVVDISKGPDQVFVAYITANAAGRYYGITSYDSAGEQVDLLVNTTEPYEGEVIAPETAILVVQAEGDWAVTDNGRT